MAFSALMGYFFVSCHETSSPNVFVGDPGLLLEKHLGPVPPNYLNDARTVPSTIQSLKGDGQRHSGATVFRVAFNCMALVFYLFFSVPLQAAPENFERVSFKTKEGTPLSGFFKKPDRNQPTFIMLHGLASAKEEWFPLTAKLDQKGWGWLIYDARGHGQSSLTKDKDGSPDGFRYFRPPGRGSEWNQMIDDVGAALSFLEKTQKLERSSFHLVGASLGANVCLAYAALTRFPGRVLLLSPGLNYQEIRSDDFIQKISGEKILVIVSSQDQYAYASSVKLKEISPHLNLWTDVKPGHGVQMFDSALLDRIVHWFE